MTRILDRYIGRQIFFYALFAVTLFVVLLILGSVFKEILRELAKRPDLSFGFVLRFIGLVVPFALGFAVPFSFLFSILLTFGKLSSDSELVSMRMAGLGMGRICRPVAVFAVFFTVVCAWTNLTLTPWSKTEMEGMKNTLINKAKRDPLLLVQDERVMNDFPGYLIYANKEDGVLKNFQMVKLKGTEPDAIAMAKVAKLRVDEDRDELVVDMDQANLMIKAGGGSFMEKSQPVFTSQFPTGISLEKFSQQDQRLQPENLPIGKLIDFVRSKHGDVGTQASLLTELSMRLAFSVSCITFALVGVPLGITAQRKETAVGFVLSFLIAIAYYTLLLIALMARDMAHLKPHLLVWIPNVLGVSLGIFLFIRVSRK